VIPPSKATYRVCDLSYFSYPPHSCRGDDPKNPYDNLLTADVVGLESNEGRLYPPYMKLFYQFVMEHQ
jgi:hypothetical protein